MVGLLQHRFRMTTPVFQIKTSSKLLYDIPL